jgi:hypothetical protein
MSTQQTNNKNKSFVGPFVFGVAGAVSAAITISFFPKESLRIDSTASPAAIAFPYVVALALAPVFQFATRKMNSLLGWGWQEKGSRDLGALALAGALVTDGLLHRFCPSVYGQTGTDSGVGGSSSVIFVGASAGLILDFLN